MHSRCLHYDKDTFPSTCPHIMNKKPFITDRQTDTQSIAKQPPHSVYWSIIPATYNTLLLLSRDTVYQHMYACTNGNETPIVIKGLTIRVEHVETTRT